MTFTPPVAFLLQSAQPLAVFESFTPWRIATVMVLMGFTWLAIRYASRLLDFLAEQSLRTRYLAKLLQPVIRISLWFIAAFISLDLLAPTRETFFAGVASAGIAIGLGAQDLVKNLIGGLVILGDRPYQLGDRVKMGDAYGEIDHIGLRSTKLTTSDDTRVTIPNADVLTQKVFNANSGVPDCQVVTDLFLPIDTDPVLALQIGKEAALTSPYLLISKPVVALVGDVLDHRPCLRLRVKAYVYDHRFEPRFQSDVTVRAKTEFRRLGLLDGMPGA